MGVNFPLTIALAALLSCALAQNGAHYFLSVPDVVQAGTEQKACVSVFNVNNVQVNLQILSYPEGAVLSSPSAQAVSQGNPVCFSFLIPPCHDIEKNYVQIRVFSQNAPLRFDHRRRLVLSCKSESVFVQTDKPIYIRNDVVHARFAVVRYDLLSVDTPRLICYHVQNPQNISVDRVCFNATSDTTIERKDIALGPSPVTGIWKIVVKRCCLKKSVINCTDIAEYHFEVKDYVLPRFGVTIDPPASVSLADEKISFGVKAKYTYGKGVVGFATVRVGAWNDEKQIAEVFRKFSANLLPGDEGTRQFEVPNDNWLQQFPEGRRLYLYVEVKEKASGISQNKSDTSAFFTSTPIILDCDLTPPFYKPSLPFQLRIRAKYRNGAPASADVKATLQSTGTEYNGKTSFEDGTVGFAVNVGASSGRISFTLQVKNQNVADVCHFDPFTSPPACAGATVSFVARQKHAQTCKTGVPCEFEVVKKEQRAILLNVIVISCGVARQSFSLQSADEPLTTFSMTFGADVCSKAKVVVYHINSCNRVEADMVVVNVEKRCSNDVSLEIDNSQSHLPGSSIDLTINAAADSEIALLAVDRGLYLLNDKNKLSKDQIFEDLLEYDKSCGYTTRDSKGVFEAAGLTTSTGVSFALRNRESDNCPARRSKREIISSEEIRCLKELCDKGNALRQENSLTSPQDVQNLCNRGMKNLESGVTTTSSGCPLTTKRLLEFGKCCLSDIEMLKNRARSQGNIVAEPENFEDKLVQTRSYFPEVWLWDEFVTMGGNQRITKSLSLPDSITEWVFQALAFSKTNGFCVAEPKTIRVFKSVFVECHVPFSFRRQEQVSLKCTAYNYRDGPLAVGMQLRNPSDGLCTTAGSGKSTHLERFRVPAKDTVTHVFPFVPLSIGEPNVTISLISADGEDHLIQKVRVVPEGVLDEYDYSAELDPQGLHVEGGPKCSFAAAGLDFRRGTCFRSVTNNLTTNEPVCGSPLSGTFSKTQCCDNELRRFSVAWTQTGSDQCELCPTRSEQFICNNPNVPGGLRQENTFYTRLPETYVPGSDIAWISCTGKYFEGTITTIDGISSILNYPHGCGEQNMIQFAPNVAVAKYLRATGQPVSEKRKDVMQKGYQWELKYYRENSGAFAVFVREPNPSTWLTAFVLQIICKANDFVYIDPNVISSASNYLAHNTQNDDGTFSEKGRVIHREMVGGVQAGDASLTAFVIISMLECKCNTAPTEAICKGVSYLKSQIDSEQIIRPYARAITYLALLRACKACKKCNCDPNLLRRARELLDKKAVINEDGSKYWPVNVALGKAYWYHRRPEAISVETTAYALCGYVAAGDVSRAGPIAKWLNSARNSRGSFVSTQDTVVALKCLAEYAVSLHQERSINVKVSARHNKAFGANFYIRKQNLNVNYRREVPVNDIIKVETTGTGLGICQLHVQYNVPQAPEDRCRFDFTVNAEKFRDENDKLSEEGKYLLVSVCARYLGENNTGMSIVEVDLPTGYEACIQGNLNCLAELQKNHGKNLGLTLYEVYGTGPKFYFDTIPTEEPLCFAFRANKKYDVKRLLPTSARVYDYYEPDEACTKFFTIDGSAPKLSIECKKQANKHSPLCVCGKERCPSNFDHFQNRLCQAHCERDYAYKISVLNITDNGEWQEITCRLEKVLKQGKREDINEGDEFTAYLPQICGGRKILEPGKVYHVQGKDGAKFIFDDSSLIEEWPKTSEFCAQDWEEKCDPPSKEFKKSCDQINNSKKKKLCKKERKSCVQRRQGECQKKVDKEFDCYVKTVGKFQQCFKSDICVRNLCAKD